MKKALAEQPVEDFSAPDGIIFRQVDPRTGLLSTENCRLSIREAFLPGTEPRRYCDEPAQASEEPQIQDEAPVNP
jgi:membrane carboxypeptidase/penicillin-binding protein